MSITTRYIGRVYDSRRHRQKVQHRGARPPPHGEERAEPCSPPLACRRRPHRVAGLDCGYIEENSRSLCSCSVDVRRVVVSPRLFVQAVNPTVAFPRPVGIERAT